jgi:hypothetical protein
MAKIKLNNDREGIDQRMLTMQEAMEYLAGYGIPCKSRKTFYKLLPKIQYTNTNICGKNETRRFALPVLNKYLVAQGIKVTP